MSIQFECSGTSLKHLVSQYGFGIKVRSTDKVCRDLPFTVVSEHPEQSDFYLVTYQGIEKPFPLKNDCKTTNDYVLVK